MAGEQENTGGYGYQDDVVKQSPLNFGGNFGKTYLTKFEFIPNAGKDGAEQEALEAIFKIGDAEKKYRIFPVTKAFLKNNAGETTDPTTPEFKAAKNEMEGLVFHIAHCFVNKDAYMQQFQKRINGFKDFCNIVTSLLPKDFASKPLDIFAEYQWKKAEGKNMTYLDIPKKMKHGLWLVPTQAGKWTANKIDDPEDNEIALMYTNEKNEIHPFKRTGWYMKSDYAIQQKDAQQNQTGGAPQMNSSAAATPANGTATPTGEKKPAQTW